MHTLLCYMIFWLETSMRTFVVFALLLLTLLGVTCFAQELKASQTRVAIIPTVNTSGEKWEDLKSRQCATSNKYLRDEFSKRGFVVIDDKEVQQAIATLNVDMSDEEQHNRTTLYKVADALKADLVVFAVVTDTNQKMQHQLLSLKREGHSKVKLWLLNSKTQKPYISAKTVDGSSGGGFFANLDKGSDRQVIAVANALRDGLKDFFNPYPALTK